MRSFRGHEPWFPALFACFIVVAGHPACSCNPTATPDGSSSTSSGASGTASSGGSSGVSSSSGSSGTDAGMIVDTPDPNRPDNDTRDSDCDGLSDAEEFGTTWPGGGKTNPGNPDTDGDGIPDGMEVGRTSSVDARCAGRFQADSHPASTTDPTRADSDGDGLADGSEDANHDGAYARGTETDPRNPDSDGDGQCDGPNDVTPTCTGGDPTPIPGATDTDGDGLPDPVDAARNDPDADDDGLCDGPGTVNGVCTPGEDSDADGFMDVGETNPASPDTDCDGLPDGDGTSNAPGERALGTDPANPDSDGDGILDGVEAGAASSPEAACTFSGDANPSTTTDPRDPDSDNDGIPDGAEDSNHNGRVDTDELDPNNPSDGAGDPTTREACALDRLVQVNRQFAAAPDLQIVTAARAGDLFTEQGLVDVPDGQNGRRVVGAVGYNPSAQVAYMALRLDPTGANVGAEETAARNRLNGLGTLGTPITYNFTTWDGYPAVHATYDMAGNSGVKARLNAVVRAYHANADGLLPTANDAAAQGFKVEAFFVRRSANTAIHVVALMPAARAGTASDFVLRDIADGSSLGQYTDALGVQCDRFTTRTYDEVDILWSIDNSVSMSDEQEALGAAAAAMQAKLGGSTVDFRTAVVSSGFFNPGGQTATPPCTSATCDETTRHQCRAFTTDLARFARWMTEPNAEWIGAGGTCNQPREEVVRSAQLILSDPAMGTASFLPAAANDPMRLRPNTNLVLIFMGDADDQYYDNAGAAAGITTYETFFRGLPVASVTMGAITCPDGSCGEAQRTPHVINGLVNRFGGVIGTLRDTAAIGPTVEAILDSVLGNVSPYRLSRPAISSTIKVAMDANSTVGTCNWSDVPRSRNHGFDYDARTGNILFFGNCRPDPAQTGSRVAASYRSWIDLSPGADPPTVPCSACANCSGLAICDLQACSCSCQQTLTCGPGLRWDASACDCVCDVANLNCGPTRQADAALCACTCLPDCGGGCTAGLLCVPSLCECESPGG